jgi:outer membrane protein assembly factor BamD
MKKIALIFSICGALLLSGCAQPYVKDPYKKYAKYSAHDLYAKAQKAMKNKHYDTAVQDFEALDGLYPFDTYARKARLEVIYAYYMNEDETSTVVAAERYLHLQPRSKGAAYAYYMRGIASFSKGQSWLQKKFNVSPADRDPARLLQAYSSFRTVVMRYPTSIYKKDSQLRMAYIRNLLAEHYMRVARYYYSINAYVAAANRASKVVSRYQGARQMPDALAMLVKSYRKLKLPSRAAQSYAILKANYPSSAAYKSL